MTKKDSPANSSVSASSWPQIDGIPSVFSSDPHFCPRGEQGRSKAQIAADSVTEASRKASTIYGMSEKADNLIAMRNSGISLDPDGSKSQLRRQRIQKASI